MSAPASKTREFFSREHVAGIVRRLGATADVRRPHVLKLLKARRFPGGWWHAGDVESAIDGLRASLEELGLEEDGVEEALASGSSDVGDEDEDELRRHQIGWVVRVTNAKLEARSDPRRLYAFDERTCGAETDEPAWMLLAKEERDALVDAAVLVPLGPGTLEEAYDPSDRG